jgi:hypothetical protein
MGGVGTVTDRCGDDVVGFGHPMMFRGRTSLGLMPADALQVQEESLGAPFKVVNLAAPVGTITQDRLTGITGSVGSPPPAMTATSKVTYGARDRTGESASMLRDWNLDVTLTQMLAVHDVAIDAIQPGSKTATVRIDGTSGDDEPFRIRAGDRFVSDGDIALEGLWQTGDLLWVLSRIKGVDLTEVRTGADVVDSTDVLRLRSIQQRRHGGWVTLDRRHPARAQAGGDLRVRVQLRGPQGPRRLVLEVSVPARARGEGRLEVAGGSTLWNEALWEADTLAEVERAVAREVRNDEVQARVDFWPRRDRVSRRVVSTPQELVVRGQRSVDVVVRR